MNGTSESRSKVGRARCDVAEMTIVIKLCNFLHMSDSPAKPLKDLRNIRTWLHRNNSQLILLVDPDQEGLIVVMKDASAIRPVIVEVAGFEEAITFFEEEVVRH